VVARITIFNTGRILRDRTLSAWSPTKHVVPGEVVERVETGAANQRKKELTPAAHAFGSYSTKSVDTFLVGEHGIPESVEYVGAEHYRCPVFCSRSDQYM